MQLVNMKDLENEKQNTNVFRNVFSCYLGLASDGRASVEEALILFTFCIHPGTITLAAEALCGG